MPRIPDLPGDPVPHRSDQELWLKKLVSGLCHLEHDRFPGSQPVSFATNDLDKLEKQDFWVCEKSDGVRVLLLVQTDLRTNDQGVYFIDRHNSYRQLSGLFFPHHEDPRKPLRNSIIDGELVIDVDPRTKQETMRFLAFDCLVVDDQNVMARPLDKRYGRLQEWFYKPYSRMLRDHPQMAQTQPFEVKVKTVKMSYHAEEVFRVDIPALQHGNDGLIYTCVATPYTAGTDPNILKWKPPSENSIDFRLVLRFPPSPNKATDPDYYAKPIFELHTWNGGSNYEFWDVMTVKDDEWEKLKSDGDQLDDRVVEVHWDVDNECWRMMRFRDDKPNGNHKSVVDGIIKSIADGVEKDALLARSSNIRNAWKARLGQPSQPPPPQGHQATKPPPTQQPHPPSGNINPYQPASSAPQPPPPGPSSRSSLPPPPPSLPPPPTAIPAIANSKVPNVQPRYGPLGESTMSKVAGPHMVAGMYR
ncbi:Dcp1p-Dcp2p decapping enzyme complex alpha subunit [Steccherinum ochraceum]|uniref:mRNA guanylyltransferase n=1 Tax=Steccherinum ochraceum TaxID=92696 RepID=A0A4R0R8S2_9APHY|nr:Dcp1p-Dcp2p decapping enzyme complex alpha subunit [Steccherinum ochraceum]